MRIFFFCATDAQVFVILSVYVNDDGGVRLLPFTMDRHTNFPFFPSADVFRRAISFCFSTVWQSVESRRKFEIIFVSDRNLLEV